VLAAIIAISAHVVWLTERHRPDSDFPSAYLPGIWEGIWWSAVTVTTVGYGDRTPRSVFGRFFGLIWMFAGLFIIANFTAAVTTQLTVNEIQSAINGPSDLYGKRVGTVAGSTAADWLAEHNIPHVSMDVVEDAYDLLETGRVDAVVYDYPVLKYYAVDAGDGQVEVTGGPFNEENYGIAFATGSPLREEMNRALLHLYESGFYDTLYFEWFGEDPSR
jgi:polar amino acid transport system substrate-binding protein